MPFSPLPADQYHPHHAYLSPPAPPRSSHSLSTSSFPIHMLSPSTSNDSCQICGQKSIGNNFGARTCRACAAFFRRNALNEERFKFRCEKANCEPVRGGKFFCKKCRLKKCLEMGMDAKKFQLERDILKTASNFKSSKKPFEIPPSLPQFLGRPASILCCEPEKASHIKLIINVSPMIRKVEEILRKAAKTLSSDANGLLKLTDGFQRMRKPIADNDMAVVTFITKDIALKIWEDSFVDTATWLTNWQEFRVLPERIQMTIVKSGWLLWSKLEHLSLTADYMRALLLSGNHLIVGNDVGIDIQNVDFDLTWATNYSKEQAKQFFLIDLNGNFANIVKMLIELDPSKTELNYMLCHLCLFMAGKRHSEISAITDKLLEVLANDLHGYYKSEKCANYSLRIAKMMKINNVLFKDMRERDERNQMIQLFNLLCFEFSEMEMFRGN